MPERRGPPPWRPASAARALAWARRQTAASIERLDHEGRYYYRDALLRVDPQSGERTETPVLVAVPTHVEKMRARLDALDRVKALAGLKERPSYEEAEKLFSPSYVDQLDTLCLLARCVYDPDETPQHLYMTPEDLDRLHSRGSLAELWERLEDYQAREDPRPDELAEHDFARLVEEISEAANASPLLSIGGPARERFVTTMAVRLASCPTCRSLWLSPVTGDSGS